MLRPPAPRVTKDELKALVQSRSDHMFVTASYIAFWHEGLESVVLIPGDFRHVSDQQANQIFQANLIKLRELTQD